MAKKSLMVILGLGPKKGGGMMGEDGGEGGSMKEHKLAAAKELISAVKAGDAQAVSDALQAAYELCEASKDYEEGDEEEAEAEDGEEEESDTAAEE